MALFDRKGGVAGRIGKDKNRVRCPYCGMTVPPKKLKKTCINCLQNDGELKPDNIYDAKQTTCSKRNCGAKLRYICRWSEGKSEFGCNHAFPVNYIGSKATFISMVGARGTGKSQFLMSLTILIGDRKFGGESIPPVIMADDKSIDRMTRALEYYHLHKTVPPTISALVSGSLEDADDDKRNPDDILGDDDEAGARDPYVMRMKRKINGVDHIEFIVLYDPAGEDLSKGKTMSQVAGNFLRNSDAIIYCIDPQRIHALDGLKMAGTRPDVTESDYANNTLVLQQLVNVVGTESTDIHMAVALTKVDLLQKDPERGEERLVLDKDLFAGINPKEFDMDEVQAMSDTIRLYLESISNPSDPIAVFLDLVDENFPSNSFFGVSALGYAPEGEKIAIEQKPSGIPEPVLWALAKSGSEFLGGRS